MSIVLSTLRDDVMRAADAFGSRRWDATRGGEVDRRISSVYDKVWRRILNVNRHYRVAKRLPTSDGTGRYPLSDLDGGSGDTLQRLYRILSVIIDGQEYNQLSLEKVALAELDTTTTSRGWYQEGIVLTALPLQPAKLVDAIWVNWIPQRPAALSADAAIVDFPDGHDDVLVMLGAARVLMKGGAETQASRELQDEVRDDYEEMLQDIARLSTKPLVMQHGDSAAEWAGG